MRIHGMTVCVNYADILAHGLSRWLGGLDGLLVVTTPGDKATEELLQGTMAKRFQTNAFYEDGAAFNKGRAMAEAVECMPWTDWLLFFDADVVPPQDWRRIVTLSDPKPGLLHGASRVMCTGPEQIDAQGLPLVTIDGTGVGFFQLVHASDPALKARPVFETDWLHAGNYDNGFMARWPHKLRRRLPLTLYHIGPRDQWFGRGNDAAFDAMQAERKRRGGHWQHERVCVPSEVRR